MAILSQGNTPSGKIRKYLWLKSFFYLILKYVAPTSIVKYRAAIVVYPHIIKEKSEFLYQKNLKTMKHTQSYNFMLILRSVGVGRIFNTMIKMVRQMQNNGERAVCLIDIPGNNDNKIL